MEPKSPTPRSSPELPTVVARGAGETLPVPRGPEFSPDTTIERHEQAAEAASQAETPAAPPVLPTTIVPVVSDDDAASASPQTSSTSPAVANDDELIEKEWVDKAKKAITETKDDPYAREKRVSQLQADYLWKRYGRQLKSPQ